MNPLDKSGLPPNSIQDFILQFHFKIKNQDFFHLNCRHFHRSLKEHQIKFNDVAMLCVISANGALKMLNSSRNGVLSEDSERLRRGYLGDKNEE